MNPENSKLMEGCFRSARITGELSDSSVLKYRDSVKKFFAVIGENNFEMLAKIDFENFIIKMQDNDASNSRIANVISAVKWVLKRAQDEGTIQKSLDLDVIKKPKIEQKDQPYLTEDEIKRLVATIQEEVNRKGKIIRVVRFMAFTKLLLQTGCRIGEALSIKTKDIDWKNNEIPIIGKGGKPRILTIREDTKFWLKEYLSVRIGACEFVFSALNGKNRWRQTDVGRSFRRYKKMSGIKKDFTIHALRRTLATHLFHQGVDPSKVQLILGHSRLETTVKYYLKAAQEKVVKEIMMKDEYFNFIPQSAIKEVV